MCGRFTAHFLQISVQGSLKFLAVEGVKYRAAWKYFPHSSSYSLYTCVCVYIYFSEPEERWSTDSRGRVRE